MGTGNNKIANKQKDQPIGTGVSNPIEGSKVDIFISLLIINVFFDGTRNNMHNSTSGREKGSTTTHKDVSYENYYSNIALLYMAFQETKIKKRVYIEGSGSAKGQKDDIPGLATSGGNTGVKERIKKTFELVEEILAETKATRIIFNLFGFSRGSFFARYFCHLVKTAPEKHGLSLSKGQMSVNFMGLYDTVSSAGLNHYNDVKEFKLNIGKAHGIRKIVHLTAQNEYRNHFPLTRVNTAVNDGIAFECSLPGAHSDIGGGYGESSKEEQYLSRFKPKAGSPASALAGEVDWLWFKNKGYYKGEPKADINSTPHQRKPYDQFALMAYRASSLLFHNVYANRSLTYDYQFIPLEIMRDIAIAQANLSFDGPTSSFANKGIALVKRKTAQGGVSVLEKFRNHAYTEIIKNYTKTGLDFKIEASAVLNPSECQELYNKYIHNSLNPEDVANGSDGRNKGPKRIIINDNV